MSSSLSNWSYVPLQEVVGKITSGGTPKAGTPSYYGGDIPFLKIKDLTNSTRFVDSASLSITERGLQNSSARVFPSGTVLTTMYGTIGVTRILRKPMATNQAIAAFLELRGITSEFLMQLINFEAEKLASMASQTTQANISATVLKEYLVDIPPLPEQKKIASILTSVDEVIENTQKQIDKLQDLKKATMNELLTKGIGHTEFKDSELGRIPKSWEVKKLKDIGDCIRGLTYSPDDIAETGLLVLRSSNIQHGRIYLGDNVFVNLDVTRKFRTQVGDLLICVRNGSRRLLGKSAIIPEGLPPSTHGAFMTVFRTPLNEYVQFLLQSEWFFTQVSRDIGATINSINNSNLLEYLFAFPTHHEQTQITNQLKSIESLIVGKSNKLSQTQSLKKSLMQDLLTGKVRVTMN